MQRWSVPVIVLFVAFLALTGWLSYQVAIVFIQSNSTREFQSAFSANNYPPSPAEVDSLLEDFRSQNLDTDDPYFGYIYVDLLARRAWNHPETALEDTRQAISTAQKVYRNHEHRRPHMVRWLIYLYASAGLPSKVELWQSEAIARDPFSLEYVRYFQISSLISLDDLTGARALLEEELGPDEPRPTAAGLALAGYGLFNDIEKAAEYERYIDEYGFIDDYFKHTYVGFLIEQARYADAAIVMDEIGYTPEDDPDNAMRLALIYAGRNGVEDPETAAMIDLSLTSTRYPFTRDEFVAGLYADLYRIEKDPAYLVPLFHLHDQYPDNASITYSFAISATNCWRFHRDAVDEVTGVLGDPVAQLTPEETVFLEKPPAAWCREALELAQSEYEHLNAGIQLATVLTWPDGVPEVSVSNLREAIEVLRRTLGDSRIDRFVSTERSVDYEYFLIDEQVQAARAAHPWFDIAVNHAVIDYLNLKRLMYNDIVPLEPLAYRDDSPPVEPEETDPLDNPIHGVDYSPEL